MIVSGQSVRYVCGSTTMSTYVFYGKWSYASTLYNNVSSVIKTTSNLKALKTDHHLLCIFLVLVNKIVSIKSQGHSVEAVWLFMINNYDLWYLNICRYIIHNFALMHLFLLDALTVTCNRFYTTVTVYCHSFTHTLSCF